MGSLRQGRLGAPPAAVDVGRRRLLLGLAAVGLGPLVGCAAPAHGVARPTLGGHPATRSPTPERPAPPSAPIAAASAPPTPTPEGRFLRLPPRTEDAETGSAFLERTAPLGSAAFEEAVFDAIAGGNVPPSLRRLAPVRVACERDGARCGVVHVLCDYLAIGSDDDFLRIPMTASTAQRIAILTGCVLPTRKLVDTIFEQAEARLPPSFIEGGPTLSTRLDYAVHQCALEAHRARRRFELGALTAGDKKDIVLTNRLVDREDRVAIYGWHRDDGRPIQPLSTVHGRRYADYSHGVRLVDGIMLVDGAEHRVTEVLRDPRLADLLSDEGPLEVVAYPTQRLAREEHRPPKKKTKKKGRKRRKKHAAG